MRWLLFSSYYAQGLPKLQVSQFKKHIGGQASSIHGKDFKRLKNNLLQKSYSFVRLNKLKSTEVFEEIVENFYEAF